MKKTFFRKCLVLICALTLCFAFVGCGSSNQASNDELKKNKKDMMLEYYQSTLESWAESLINQLDTSDAATLVSDVEMGNISGANSTLVEFCNSWINTANEVGALVSINKIETKVSDETGTLCVINVDATYENFDSVAFEFVISDELEVTGAAINPSYSVGQKFYKAIMNTLIGMGTVFLVLIFISFIISLFKYINKFTNKEKKSDVAKEGVDNAIAQIVSNEEDLSDDCELVAVIAAAIAAYEGTSTDGFKVRSIRKVNRR